MSHGSGDARGLAPSGADAPAAGPWGRIAAIAAGTGAAATVAALALATADPRRFYFSWLVAFASFLGIALGGLFFVLMHFASRAGWSVAVRRLAENAMATLPWFAPMFVPVLVGLPSLFPWAAPGAAARSPALANRAAYLNPTFFAIRAAAYFLCWSALAIYFARASRRQDGTRAEGITRRLEKASGPAIVATALTVSFAAIDWLMSLEPGWASTMFGVYFFAGSLVAIYAFLSVVAIAVWRARLTDAVTPEHLHDLGKLLFAFTVFWAYIAFSQYFLIWYANLPEETGWYAVRMDGTWRGASLLLAVGHFVVPFFYLLPRVTKRRAPALLAAAVWILAMHYLDVYWLVMPALDPRGIRPAALDLACLLAVGGFFVAAFSRSMRRHAIVPTGDPRLAESLSFESA